MVVWWSPRFPVDDVDAWSRPTRRRFVVGALAAVGVGGAGLAAVHRALAAASTAPQGTGVATWQAVVGEGPDPERIPDAPIVADPVETIDALEPIGTRELDPRWQPATAAATKILALRKRVEASLTVSAYEHRTVIDRKAGIYRWDCSGMAAWFLRKAAPAARRAMDKGRPVARDFYRKIAKSPTRRARDGWRRLPHIDDVQPGDLFAWIRPPGFPSRNTGHMGFAAEPARAVPHIPGAYTLRIFDATSLPHQDDTRDPEGDGGIGEGTILFLTDETGRGTAYGWFGLRSQGVIATDIVFGRVYR
ncbi:MAG: hypothetical protein K0V04_23105 [Deltaproteobacteria bacterium]|nr:hypothetical protein [Deltaproteobacteria bacterium]